MNTEGGTIEDLELEGDESRTQELVKSWLRNQLDEKQRDRETLMAER
jgi:hypothetical protein